MTRSGNLDETGNRGKVVRAGQNETIGNPQDLESSLQNSYEGRISDWKERFPEDRITHYKDGGSGGVYKAWDTKRKCYVGIKELKGSKEGVDLEFLQTGEGQLRNIKDVINVFGNSQHPGLMRVHGYYEVERRRLKHPQLVFELLEYPSLLDHINSNGSASEEQLRRFLVAGGLPLHDIHTSNGQPVFHRDVKPENYIEMPLDGRWPNVLVDLGSVGLGIRETFKGTQRGTFKYVPQMQWAFGKVNKGTDNFALIRSAIHYALGRRFDEVNLDELDVKKLELNYSPALQKVFSSAMTQDESKWYYDFGRVMNDLGYRNDRIPGTRQELEAILGHKALPVGVETQKPAEPQQIQSQSITYDFDNTFRVAGIDTLRAFNIESSPHETIKAIKNSQHMVKCDGEVVGVINDFEKSQVILSYFNEVVPQHPILREVLSGEKTLEEIAGEKGPSLIGKIRRGLSHRKDFNKTTEDYLKITLHESVNSAIDNYKIEKEAHKERREQLYNIFGENKKTLLPFRERLRLDMQSSALEALANNVLILVFAPIYPALQMHAAIVKQKIKKKSRKLDSYIAGSRTIGEWRESQKPKGDLEGKVGLTGGEKERIENIITKMGDKIIYGSAILGASLGAIQGEHIEDKIMGFSTFGLLGWLGGLWMERKILNPLEKYLTNKKLREKRLAAGLDEDVREQTKSIRVNERKLLSIEDKGIDFLGDDLGKEVDKEIQKKYGAFAGISAIGYKRWSKIVKGSTPFYVVAVNEFFRDNGINLKSASQADLERALKSGALNLRGTYEDTALVLRDEDNPNQYLAKNLMEQVKARDKKQEMPVMIPLNGLELKIDSNAPHGLAFKLTDASEIIYAPILNKSGNFNSEDINEKTGLPNKTGKGNRTLYTRNSGLSRLYLVNVLYVLAGNVDLAYSNDYGRVVVVSAEGASLKTRKPIEVDLLPDNMKDMNSADWDEVERITGEKVKRRIR